MEIPDVLVNALILMDLINVLAPMDTKQMETIVKVCMNFYSVFKLKRRQDCCFNVLLLHNVNVKSRLWIDWIQWGWEIAVMIQEWA